jgi:hypothetical protein
MPLPRGSAPRVLTRPGRQDLAYVMHTDVNPPKGGQAYATRWRARAARDARAVTHAR